MVKQNPIGEAGSSLGRRLMGRLATLLGVGDLLRQERSGAGRSGAGRDRNGAGWIGERSMADFEPIGGWGIGERISDQGGGWWERSLRNSRADPCHSLHLRPSDSLHIWR